MEKNDKDQERCKQLRLRMVTRAFSEVCLLVYAYDAAELLSVSEVQGH